MIFYIPEDSYVEVENMICPDHLAFPGNYNPEIMNKQRDKFLAGINSGGKRHKLYSSRSHAKFKFVTNESEMTEVLRGHGYESLCFEDYMIEENIQLLANSSSLISMHGANLS